MIQAMVTLTSEESKRLIAKAIVRMESVRKAQKEGLIGFSLCTSSGYIVEEILGKDSIDISAYCSGFIHRKGSCCVPDRKREKLLLLLQGTPHWLDFPEENFARYFDRMNKDDIIIKSGNLMDPDRNVGVLLASPDGGEAGAYLPHIAARGIQLIVPMSLNKTVPVALSEILPYMGILKFKHDRVHGMSCGMFQLFGQVVTEVDAFAALFDVKAIPAAMDGVGNGAGTVTLVLVGEPDSIEAAWQAVTEIKGEQKLRNYFSNCKNCEEGEVKTGGSRCSTRLKR